jgi:hypothetical protein
MTTQNVVNIQQDTPNSVTVNQDDQNLVTVQTVVNSVTVATGTIASGPTKRYVHSQGIALSTWAITHSLGGRPQITIVDSAGTVVYGEIQYLSNTQIEVSFSAPFSGYAYLT